MRFIVVTYGTEGDTRPLSALCRGLLDAGHEAHLLADAATLGSARSLGVPATALAGDIKGAFRVGGSSADGVAPSGGAGRLTRALAEVVNGHCEAWMQAVVAAGQGSDAVVLSGLAAFVGLSAAECLGVRAIGVGLIPITPTQAFASPFLPPRLVPPFLNRTSHRFVNAMIWRAFRKATNAARATVCGLPPRRHVWRSHPMLYGISPSLVPRPDDWPGNARICGQWTLPSADWSPSGTLSDFLAAGEPPLYVGFGSMGGLEHAHLLDEVVAAVAGRRVLFQPGWGAVDTARLPSNFFVLGDTPHASLFPRTSLVVHHGGSGTTHSAARAGVPSVVVPFAGDQFFWAERLTRLGVAPRAVRARHLRARALARAIETAGSASMRANARALGERMRPEDGIGSAVAAIEAIMAG